MTTTTFRESIWKATPKRPIVNLTAKRIELAANSVQGDFDALSGLLRHITAENDVVGDSKGKGNTSHMTAQKFEMDLGGKHLEPLQGVATGSNVHINMESQPVLNISDKTTTSKGPEKKMLAAGVVKFGFQPDTHGLKDAETVGPGTLVVIPSADPKAGEKVITAGQFLMSFDARSRIESLHGTAPTQVLFRPPANAPVGSQAQVSQADHLDAIFDSGTQTLREVRQTGNFQYRDGDRQASSDEAHYDAQGQSMLLLGHPQVWDPNSRVRAQKMFIDMRTNTSTGEGKVQATHLPTPYTWRPQVIAGMLPSYAHQYLLADKNVRTGSSGKARLSAMKGMSAPGRART